MLSAVLSGIAAMAMASPARFLRVALYNDTGVAPPSFGNLSEALADMVEAKVISTLTILNGPEIASLLTNDRFDLVVFPGGSGHELAGSLKVAGTSAVKRFVTQGGGYYGTCAGAYLAGTASCCREASIAGYCNGTVGCVEASFALELVQMGAAEPWDRGHGTVNMTFSAEAVATLRLDPARYGPAINTSVLYFQGPVQDRQYGEEEEEEEEKKANERMNE